MNHTPYLHSLFNVAGKNVLVTGGSRGIGLMIASGFMRCGANVLITSRDENACKQAVESLRTGPNYGGSLRYVISNVSSREGCIALAQTVSQIFHGRLDVLVNNAGCSWGEEPYDKEGGKSNWGFDKVLDLNVKGVFYLTRECVPMLERSTNLRDKPTDAMLVHRGTSDMTTQVGSIRDPARVINIGSVAGFVPQEAPTHAYDVSKAAMHHLTKKMAADLAPKGITVNAIAPGFVPTRMSQGLKTWGPDQEDIAKAIPLSRMGNMDDMAGAAIYLSSPAGSWITGVILNVDGGTIGTMRIPLASL
jgi:NAD(P)-dependent dehydrogenase (short-subunit alcohol dehydrogenase family)